MKYLVLALLTSLVVIAGPTAGPALACRPVAGLSYNPCDPYMPPPPPVGVKHRHRHHVAASGEHIKAWQ